MICINIESSNVLFIVYLGLLLFNGSFIRIRIVHIIIRISSPLEWNCLSTYRLSDIKTFRHFITNIVGKQGFPILGV